MKGGSFYKRWARLETMCSSFPLKLGGEDEVLESSLRATIGACGFMSKAMGARASYCSCGSGQNQARRENFKNAHFQDGLGLH